MILSASRRTDIPCFYSEWFLNRLKEGFLYVRNPRNPHHVSRIPLSPTAVDGIVFWTKNPMPMLSRLAELEPYPYYVQFTLTGYGRDVEPGLPDKKKILIPAFRSLAEQIGSERVIWRYDPILFGSRYTPDYHLRAFTQIADALQGSAGTCVISFVDRYAKNRKNLQALGAYLPEERELLSFCRELADAAARRGIRVVTCAEDMNLSSCGIGHGSCIDKTLIERITGHPVRAGKDRNQRPACGCAESVDVGTYHTCPIGCRYCYANDSPARVARERAFYDPHSPLLCGRITEQDVITERKAR